MNIEFVRRETTKKIMGLTELPIMNPVTIAKGLKAIDFIGMIVDDEGDIDMVTKVTEGTDRITITIGQNKYNYVPSTGVMTPRGET